MRVTRPLFGATRGRVLRIALSLILLSVALLVLRAQLRTLSLEMVSSHIQKLPHWRIVVAVGITIANYTQLTLYDVIGVRYIRQHIPYRKLAPFSFIATAFGHNIGPSLLSGGSVRYRFYSGQGLSGSQIATLITFISVTFFLGFCWVVGFCLSTLGSSSILPLPLPSMTLRVIGALGILLGCGYVGLCILAHMRSRLPVGLRIELPSPALAAAQICVAATDWLAMSLVLTLLLPIDLPMYPHLFRVLVVSQFAGILSQVPAGIGVFEALVIHAFSAYIPLPDLVGGLVAYRLIYHLLPLAMGVATLVGVEVHHGRNRDERSQSSHD